MKAENMTVEELNKGGKVYYGWWIVAVSVLAISTNPGQFAFSSLGLFIIPLEQEFGWTRASISWAATCLGVSIALSSPIIGNIIDRFGSRRVVIPSTIIYGVLLAAIPLLVSELWHLLLIFTLIGIIGTGANAPGYLRAISAWFDRRRGLAIGIALSGSGLGYAYAPPLIQYLIDEYSWRFAYTGLAMIILFLTVPMVFLLLKDSPLTSGLRGKEKYVSEKTAATEVDQKHSSEDKFKKGLTRKMAMKTKIFWLMCLIFCATSFCFSGLMPHLVPLLIGNGMDTVKAAFAASAMGVTMVIARIVVGHLNDKYFAPHVATFCFLLSVVGIAVLALTISYIPVFIAVLLLGFSIGADLDLLAYLTGRYFGLRSFAEIYGLIFAANMLGVATGPVVYGYVHDVAGSYNLILLICAAINIVAATVIFFFPSYPSDQDFASAQD